MPNLAPQTPAKHVDLKWVTAVCVVLAGFAIASLWLQDRFDIGDFKAVMAPLTLAHDHHPWLFTLVFFLSYVAATALCIPLEVPFALAAGALFGFAAGVLLASFASICGATCAFLAARFLLRATVQRIFRHQMEKINRGFDQDGVFYLINMRLVPIVPFGMCNVLMGLTNIRVRTFFVVSQACMIFATMIFVNAGTELYRMRRLSDIMSPSLIAGFALLALLPWLGRAAVRRARGWTRRRQAPATDR